MRDFLGAHLHSGRSQGSAADGLEPTVGRQWGWYGPYGDWDPRPAPAFNYLSLARSIVRQALTDISIPSRRVEASAWFAGEQCEDLCQLLHLNVRKIRAAAVEPAARRQLVRLLLTVEQSERAPVI